ncbi:hypothetical protein F2Q68_00025496 [Brassica cretica]|uniref:Retrotransposon gag domain-containing protein n=1 Tax=Brassica cretica TaxID=69181 RepID=A0A8S9IK49_BRACR|nr:hypothetical protein F2Q68_00025496 [Brassica cretica]
MSSEKFPVFNGVADELRPWISSIEVGTIKRDGETSSALRRTSMEVSRDVSTELIQFGAFTMGVMEIPVFSGDDLRPWINWMENRFAAEDFTDDQKMVLAYAVIRGEAESWYNNRADATNIEETDSCLVTDCDHDDDDNDHDDSGFMQEALHYEETILAEEEEVELKPEDRTR